MEQLPKTLDGFYDRILLSIEEADQEHARLALQWLAFAARPISLEELAEAVIIRREDEPYVNDEDRFLDYKDILEILPSGLVSIVISNEGHLEYESDSVREHDSDSDREYDSDSDSEYDSDSDIDNANSEGEEEHKDVYEQRSQQSNDSVKVRFGSDSDREHDLDSDIGYANSEGEEENKDVDEQRSQQSNDSFKDGPEVKDEGKAKNIKSKLMVQFAHFSVKEYLTSDRSGLKYHIDEISANKVIAESCFAYLIYTGIQEPAITWQIHTDFPLLHYAANCWPHHVHMLQSQSIDEHWLKLALYFLQNDSCAWRVWAAVGFVDEIDYAGPLGRLASRRRRISARKSLIHPVSWVSRLGLSCLLQHLLVEDVDLNEIPQTPNLGNPLYTAALNGHFQVVQMLVTAGSNVGRNGGTYGRALQAASARGDTETVRLLLQEGAEVNAQGGFYSSALQAASLRGHTETARLLLQEGAEVNTQGGLYGSALQAASARGQTETVRLLLQEGAEVNAQGGFYSSALQAASLRGHTETARLLLQEGAEVNTQGGFYGSALQAASARGQTETVRLLLQEGAEVNAQGGFYSSALQAASARGDTETVRLFLQEGAEVNALGGHYGSALQAASAGGFTETVRLLLQEGADVNAPSGKYGTALRTAASSGRKGVVQMLLDSGADNRADGEWDVMYKEVEKNIEKLKKPTSVTQRTHSDDGLRATKLLLDGWLAEQQSKEAEEATRLGTPKIRETGEQLATTIPHNSLPSPRLDGSAQSPLQQV